MGAKNSNTWPSGLARAMSRRHFMAAGAAAAGALALGNTRCDPAIMRRVRQAPTRVHQHAVWIWQFSEDGPAAEIVDVLAGYGLSAILKTHDGVEWMAKYDPTDGAIAGPGSVETMAATFENAGVPFHAWCVVKGIDVAREVEMASQVLDAGARSLILDVEEGESFWQGTADDARRFGYELRARHEFARIDITIDPRPWKMLALPIPEFAEFADGIRPQLYWDLFGGDDHANAYSYFGFPTPGGGVTPEFMAETAHALLAPFDRWILPVGPGTVDDPDQWARFLRRCSALAMPEVSVWRYGPVSGQVLRTVRDHPA
jgi:hypothetical protein